MTGELPGLHVLVFRAAFFFIIFFHFHMHILCKVLFFSEHVYTNGREQGASGRRATG